MARASQNAAWQKAVVLLCGVVVASAAIGALYWAQIIFVPVAMAVLLMFLLTPAVRGLERRGLPRGIAVAIIMAFTLLAVSELAYLITRQTASLAQELPDYSANIRRKIDELRAVSGPWNRMQKMVEDIATPADPNEEAKAPTEPPAVVVQPESSMLTRWPSVLGSAAEVLGGFALAIVLTAFGLVRREDLRNRFLRLVGNRRVAFTTKAVDEAGERVGRYLLTQAMVNIGYGTFLAIAFGILGVKYALLWGFFAAMLRYVPYIGAWISIMFPLAVSVATTETWTQPIAVLAVFVCLELATYNVIEPLLFKRSMGVSEVAQLVSAAFWGFLWGPIGLVLSAPLTVCLLVLGKYVPHLEFLDVLLGDEPPLEPAVSLYQRLLAWDEDDAATLVTEQVSASSGEVVYDDLLVPALSYVKRDRGRDEITEEDEEYILRAARDLVDDLGPTAAPVPKGARVRLLACPAFDEADVLALEMLARLMGSERWQFTTVRRETLVAEIVERAVAEEFPVICIGSVPPGGLAHVRYLCKRLRSQVPNAKIVVGRWGRKANGENEPLQQAGADVVATTLLATRNQLNAWLPILAPTDARPASELSEAALGPPAEHRPGTTREALATV